MSALDIIEMPGQPGKYGRRVLIDALVSAGSPPVNSLGRLYAQQKYFYDGWVRRLPGFNPADNPDDESQALAHVRFGAADIDPTPARIRRLSAAGLIRPYGYEPWHWEVPKVRSYAIVRALPTNAGAAVAPKPEEDDMPTKRLILWNGQHYFVVGDESIYHVARGDWLGYLDDHYGPALPVDNEALTLELVLRAIPWDAVDAAMRGGAFGADGRNWSRLQAEGVAIRGEQAKQSKTLADVLATAAKTKTAQ